MGNDGTGNDVVDAELIVDRTDNVGVGGGPLLDDMAAREGGCKLGVMAFICV